MKFYALLTAVLISAAPVFAGMTTNLSNHGNPASYRSDTIKVTGAGLSGVTGYGGAYAFTSSNPAIPNWGFCIELPQEPVNGLYNVVDLATTPKPAAYGTPMGAAKAEYIKELFGRFFDRSWITSPSTTGGARLESLSAAIWEIIYEDASNGWNVSSGSGFAASGVDAATANGWLGALDGTGPKANLVGLTNASGQDFVVLVPVPGALLLAPIGLGLIGLLRRRLA